MKWAEPGSDEEKDHMAELEKLVDDGKVEILEDGFRLHLVIPIPAFPDKKGVDTKIEQLKFRLLTSGDIMDSEGMESNAAAMQICSRLTGMDEKVLRNLTPHDFKAAQVVAYCPLLGPAFLPVGKSS